MPAIANLNIAASSCNLDLTSATAEPSRELDLLRAQDALNRGLPLTDDQVQLLLDTIGDSPEMRALILSMAGGRPGAQPNDAVEWTSATTSTGLSATDGIELPSESRACNCFNPVTDDGGSACPAF